MPTEQRSRRITINGDGTENRPQFGVQVKPPRLIEGRPQSKDRMYQLEPRALALLDQIPQTHPTRDMMEYFLLVAQQRRADAGYGGEHSDRGASNIEDQVELWVSMTFGRGEPSCWTNLLKAYRRDTDPEYATFLALKAKYE